MPGALSDLEPLLAPQDRLDRLVRTAFRRFGRRLVDLSYANAYGGPDPEIREALEEAVREDGELVFQYAPYGGRTLTRRLVASSLRAEYELPFEFRHVVLTPGAMAALNLVFRAGFGPRDEVIVLTPCWHDYPLYLRNLGIPFRRVPLTPGKRLDRVSIGEALGRRTRGVLLSQPCNPTGVVYSRGEIEALAGQLAAAEERYGTEIYLISDEVHRHVNWSGAPFWSPLRSHPRSLSVYSFGKALRLQGQRTGYVAVSPEMPGATAVARELERWSRVCGFCTPTDLMQRAVCRLVDYRPCWDWLAERQETARSALARHGYEVCDGDATFFVYARSPVPDDFELAELAASHGLLVVPSTLYHEPGFFRLSLAGRGDWDRAAEILGRIREELPASARRARAPAPAVRSS